MGAEYGCAECRMIDEFVMAEIEAELDELFPVIILDKMPTDPIDWGEVTATSKAMWSHKLLKQVESGLLMDKFSKNWKNIFPGYRSTGKTITFRRYGTDVFQEPEKNSHTIDALRYGMVMQHTGVWYDETQEEDSAQAEAASRSDSDSTSD